MNPVEMLTFLQEYASALLIIAGAIGSLAYLFGRLITEEMPPKPSSKESEYVQGLAFLVTLFFWPLVLILIIPALLMAFGFSINFSDWTQELLQFYSARWLLADIAVLIIQLLLLKSTQYELKNYSSRMDLFEKHEEYSKKKEVRIFSYRLAQISFCFFVILMYAHSQQMFSILDGLSLMLNGTVTILIILSTALIHGQYHPKPKILIYADFQKKPIEAFFIRRENGCIRVVPRDCASLLIPLSKVIKVEYPRRRSAEPKEKIGFMQKVNKMRTCIEKCITEFSE